MVDVAQQYLAIRRITGDPERMQEFNKAQADKLKQMAEAAELRPARRRDQVLPAPLLPVRGRSTKDGQSLPSGVAGRGTGQSPARPGRSCPKGSQESGKGPHRR